MKGVFVYGFLAFYLVVVEGLSCPDGWTRHNEFCFLFKKETYNWFDAKSACQSLGGYLAEDSTNSRHQVLTGLVQTKGYSSNLVLIGLQDFEEENRFVWDHSGRPMETPFWNPSEPGDWRGEEDCVALHHRGWDDVNCEDKHESFICEKGAVGREAEIIG